MWGLSLWATGAQSCQRPLKKSCGTHSELSERKTKSWLFTHQFVEGTILSCTWVMPALALTDAYGVGVSLQTEKLRDAGALDGK